MALSLSPEVKYLSSAAMCSLHSRLDQQREAPANFDVVRDCEHVKSLGMTLEHAQCAHYIILTLPSPLQFRKVAIVLRAASNLSIRLIRMRATVDEDSSNLYKTLPLS